MDRFLPSATSSPHIPRVSHHRTAPRFNRKTSKNAKAVVKTRLYNEAAVSAWICIPSSNSSNNTQTAAFKVIIIQGTKNLSIARSRIRNIVFNHCSLLFTELPIILPLVSKATFLYFHVHFHIQILNKRQKHQT
mmetsp:Transcript_29864/g.34688  ORF Transcript_29864/g.34688 Transcript_29864/m.34688 type:complete len:134 (-) Transcript_29864:501-902(-)